MHISDVRKTKYEPVWQHGDIDLNYLHEHRHDAAAVCSHAMPVARMDIAQNQTLTEATYKEIADLIDGSFLAQKVRADQLNGIFYRGFDENTMVFEVNSSEHEENRIRYRNLIEFDEWEQIGQDNDFNAAEKARMLLWVGNIKLHCTCPSFLYWGYQYMLNVLDSAIYPEQRPPQERNPNERGIVCKHLNRVLRVLPFYSGSIAKELRNQFGS